MSSLLTIAAPTSLNTELIEILGSIAAILATLGILLLLPIYISHRREVERLLAWKDSNPEAGTTEFRAIPGPTGPSGTGAPTRSGGKMTPAERVTSERPALTRISTGEYAAVEPEPQGFWQRVIERGPRHPLILTIVAIVVGIVAVLLASQLIRNDEDASGGSGAVNPADVQVAIVAAGSPGAGSDVADILAGKGFDITSNTAASSDIQKSGVFFAPGEKQKGKVVAKALKLPLPSPFEAEQEAAAEGADVVVIAGGDGRAAGEEPSGGDSQNDAAADEETAPAGEG